MESAIPAAVTTSPAPAIIASKPGPTAAPAPYEETQSIEEFSNDPENLLSGLSTLEFCFEVPEFGVRDPQEKPLPFDEAHFVQTKLRLGVPLETINEDLEAFRQRLQHLITENAAQKLQPVMAHIVSRGSGLKKEVYQLFQPLHATTKQLSDACGTLHKVVGKAQTNIRTAEVYASQQRFDSALLKTTLLYDQVVPLEAEVREVYPGAASFSTGAPQEALSAPAFSTSFVSSWPQLQERLHPLVMAVLELRRSTRLLCAVNVGQDAERIQQREEAQTWCTQAESAVLELLVEMLSQACHQYFESQEDITQSREGSSFETAMYFDFLKDIPPLFCVLGATEEYARACQSVVLTPLVQSVVSWTATTHTRHNIEATVNLLKKLQRTLTNVVAPLLPALTSGFPPNTLFPVSDMVWPAVCSVLTEKMTYLFDAGIPTAFRRKYLTAAELEDAVVQLCATAVEQNRLRLSAESRAWRSRWNVEIYSAECVMKAAKETSLLLEAWKSKASSVSRDGGVEAASVAWKKLWTFYEAETEHFFTDMFLPAACAAFLRHSIATAKSSVSAASSLLVGALSLPPSSEPIGEGSGEKRHTGVAHLYALSTEVLEDMRWIRHYLRTTLPDRVLQAAENTKGVEGEALKAALRTVCEYGGTAILTDDHAKVLAALEEQLTRTAIEPLQHIKSVRSMFSHTNRELPTSASWYVASSVEPIQCFVRGNERRRSMAVNQMVWRCEGAGVPAEGAADLQRLLGHVVSHLVGAFSQLARETLLAAKKAEEGWDKLRRKRGNAATTAVTQESASDRDKMVLQLYLDAKEMMGLLEAACPPGAIAAAETTVQELWALLRRGDGLQGGDIPEPVDGNL